MFYMLYMFISLKNKVRRLEARRHALTVEHLKRKRLGGRYNARNTVSSTHVFNRAIVLGEAEYRAIRIKRCRPRRNRRQRRRCRKNGRL